MPPETQVDEFAPVKAVKAQVKLKLGIAGPSSSGKTDGALALATRFGSVADATKQPKILLIDTEDRSASLYADRYEFDTIYLRAPYTPDRYKRAMLKAVEGGYDWLIVDSISHEWMGEGGITQKKDKIDLANPGGNNFANWAKIMPDHESFVEFIKQIPVHLICTMRSKQQYVLEADGKGKQKPRKVGMSPQQREGIEYEFTVVFDLDERHIATANKDRTNMFEGHTMDLRDPVIAQDLRKWLESGVVVAQPEFKPELPKPAAKQTAPTQQRLPTRAVKPQLIAPIQKQEFWTVARKTGKTDDEVRIWLFRRFKVQTSAEIPAEGFAEAMKWAEAPLAARVMQPGEAKARDAAKLLGVGEADLQYEYAMAEGDWEKVYTTLSQRADDEQAALAAMQGKTA